MGHRGARASRIGELVSADREAVVHEATPLRGFGRTKDEDIHSRVTLQVDAGHMYLHRQERCVRSDAPLPPWETDPEAGIALPRDALANLALALLPHLTGDELRRVAEAMPRVAGEWEHRERWGQRTEDDRNGPIVAEWEHYENRHQAADAEEWDWTAERPVLARTVDADGTPIETWHETPRAAQAACDARLEAAGVRLCGEVVRDG